MKEITYKEWIDITQPYVHILQAIAERINDDQWSIDTTSAQCQGDIDYFIDQLEEVERYVQKGIKKLKEIKSIDL